jgi:hypothetical protein
MFSSKIPIFHFKDSSSEFVKFASPVADKTKVFLNSKTEICIQISRFLFCVIKKMSVLNNFLLQNINLVSVLSKICPNFTGHVWQDWHISRTLASENYLAISRSFYNRNQGLINILRILLQGGINCYYICIQFARKLTFEIS